MLITSHGLHSFRGLLRPLFTRPSGTAASSTYFSFPLDMLSLMCNLFCGLLEHIKQSSVDLNDIFRCLCYVHLLWKRLTGSNIWSLTKTIFKVSSLRNKTIFKLSKVQQGRHADATFILSQSKNIHITFRTSFLAASLYSAATITS